MLDVEWYATNAGGHHLTSVVLHCVNAALLLLVLNRMTGALWRSAFVAALFAFHPLHVESVAWVSERKDVLSTFFGLLTLWAYAKHVTSDRWQVTGNGTLSSRFTLLLACASLLCVQPHEQADVGDAPVRRVAAGLVAVTKGVRCQVPRVRRNASRLTPQSWLGLVMEKLPFFALSVASCVVTFLVQKKGGAVSPLASLPVAERIANALVSYVRYVGKAVWPDDLSILYPHPGHWPLGQVILAGIFLLLVTGLVIWAGKRFPYLTVGWLWFVGTLVPVIGLVQVGIQSMAGRYTYIPLIGLGIGIAWGAGAVVERRPSRRPPFAAAGAMALVACAIVARNQIAYWQNSETLFRRAVTVTHGNYLAYNNLGFYLSKKGRVVEAMEYYRASLKINPNYEDAHNNLGHALADQKKYAEAMEHYRAALRINPNQVEVLNNLGNALSETGSLDEAISHYARVLQLKPDHADAHNNLGIALAMQGHVAEAIPHFQDAIRYKPNYASAHSNLGNAFAEQRRFEVATVEYREALKLAPDDAPAHNNLGNAVAEQGRLDEAVRQYRAALRLKAENPEAHFNLGYALARLGQREEAVLHLREALRLKPDYAEAQKQLSRLIGPETR